MTVASIITTLFLQFLELSKEFAVAFTGTDDQSLNLNCNSNNNSGNYTKQMQRMSQFISVVVHFSLVVYHVLRRL
jgi:hypothetical protein